MTDNNRLTDLVERLRDKAFKKCGPTMEAVHTKMDEWQAAAAIEELMAENKKMRAMHDEMLLAAIPVCAAVEEKDDDTMSDAEWKQVSQL